MNRISLRILNLFPIAQKYNKPIFLLTRNSHFNFDVYARNALFQSFQKLKSSAFVKLNNVLGQRNYSSDSDQDGKKKKSPSLMKFDPVLKPEILLTIKNWILTKLIVQPYLDNDFTLKDFTGGAKQVTCLYLNHCRKMYTPGFFQLNVRAKKSESILNKIIEWTLKFNLAHSLWVQPYIITRHI